MTLATLTPWQELLSRPVQTPPDHYGPNSLAVWNATIELIDTPWLEQFGRPWLESASTPPSQVGIVNSWRDALSIFTDFPKYNINGVLQAACDPCDRIVDGSLSHKAWWQQARHDVKPYISLVVPDSLSQEHQDLMFEHLYEYVSMLLVEIIAAPDAECTYFREQLTWFYAGHFPCGWDGDWPTGQLRIY